MFGKGKTVFGGLHKIAYSWAISCIYEDHRHRYGLIRPFIE